MKKIISSFIVTVLVIASSFALVDVSKKADHAADQAVAHAAQADANIKDAKNLLDKGQVGDAKAAVIKAGVFSEQNKLQAEKAAKATEEVKQKAQALATAIPEMKKTTQETKNAVNKVQDSADAAHKTAQEASEAVKEAQDAHNAGEAQKSKQHLDKAGGLLEELKQIFQELKNKIFHVHKKATSADNAVKTQMLSITPAKKNHRVGTVIRPQALIINGDDF